MPGGGEDLVASARHADDRGVEGAAAEVVDPDDVAPGRERVPMPVGVLEARRGGLVEHRDGLEACAAERVERDEPLAAVRVGGHRDGRAETALRDAAPHVRPRAQRVVHVGDEAGDEIAQRDLDGAHPDRVLGSGRAREPPLERADHGSAGRRRDIEPEAELPVLLGDDRRDPLDRVAGRIVEPDHGVVAPVCAGDDRARRSEVDAEFQSGPHSCLPRGPTSRGRFRIGRRRAT